MKLEWGIRQRFLNYISALPDSTIETTDGAVRDGDIFLLSGRRLANSEYAFDGRLRFAGHGGVLDVAMDKIRVAIEDIAGTVSARVVGDHYPIATLSNPVNVYEDGKEVGVRFETVALTDDGAAILGGVYPPGTKADPLTIYCTK